MKWVNELKDNYIKQSPQFKQSDNKNLIKDSLIVENQIKISKINEENSKIKVTKFEQLEKIEEI